MAIFSEKNETPSFTYCATRSLSSSAWTTYSHQISMWPKDIESILINFCFRARVVNFSIIQCFAPMEIFDTEEKKLFYEQLNVPQERFLKTTLRTWYMIWIRRWKGSCNDNGWRFAAFCSSYRLFIGGIFFEHRAYWVLTDLSISNQIAISSDFKSWLQDVQNKRGTDIITWWLLAFVSVLHPYLFTGLNCPA